MSTASTSAPLPADASPEALVRTLLDISPRGIALLRPRYAEAEAATIVDFTFEQLNQTAQRMLGGLPECPAESFLTLFPSAQYMEGFTFYCRAFHSGQVERYQQLYQADGFDGYYQVVAQRQGPLLVVNFTDSNDQDRSAVEQALRESQAREQVNYRLLHEAQGELYRTLRQLPAAVAVYTGPTHVLTFYNDLHEQLAGRPLTLGLPATELFPDLVGQDFFRVPDQVYATGAAAVLLEVPTPLRNPQTGEVTQHYFTVRYDPRRDAHGYVTGLLVMATSVTDQVLLRQQGQRLNEELAAANEELRANNEEYQQTNLALNETQQQLRQLNQALEVARASAEHNRAQLHALLTQAPVAIGLFTGSELRVSSINPLMADLLGYTPTQLLGQPLFEQAPELQNQGFDELMRQVQATRVPFVGREVAATVKRNGQLLGVYFNFVYQPLYDAEEQVIGIINVAVDVTEQVVARQQVEQLNAELETRVQERTQAALVAQAAAERAPASPHHASPGSYLRVRRPYAPAGGGQPADAAYVGAHANGDSRPALF